MLAFRIRLVVACVGGFVWGGGFSTVENVTSPPHLKVLKHVFSHLQWKAGLKVLLNVQI